MKKLILYLGLLCVLFSMPQVAHAADPELYIRGGMNGWNASSDWKFSHTEGTDIYTLSVPNADWKATTEFKVGAAGNENWDSYGFLAADENESIPLNGSWTLWHSTDSKNMKMDKDVPSETKVTFNTTTCELVVGEIVNPGTSDYVFRFTLGGKAGESGIREGAIKFTHVTDNLYHISDFGGFQGMDSNNSDAANRAYFNVTNGDKTYGPSDPDNMWINPDNSQTSRTFTETTNQCNVYFLGTNGKSKLYNIEYVPSTKTITFKESSNNFTPLFIRGDMNNWGRNRPMQTTDGVHYTLVTQGEWTNTQKFKVATGDWTTAWGNHSSIPWNKEVTLTTNTGDGTDAKMVENVPIGSLVEFNKTTGAFKVSAGSTENISALYYRYNSTVGADGEVNPNTWVYSNKSTAAGENKFTGTVNFRTDNGAICFASRPQSGWTGQFNIGPAEVESITSTTPNQSFAGKEMVLGETGYWILSKGLWKFEADFSDAEAPKVTFTYLGDGSADNHDEHCTAPKVFITGPATGQGWNFNNNWQMTHVSGDHYTFTVPAANNWDASNAFKVVIGQDWNQAYGGVGSIKRNVVTPLTQVSGANDSNAATTLRDVPAGAVVEFNTETKNIRIIFSGSETTDVAERWAINGSYAQPELYVVGDKFNSWEPNPGYRMTRKEGQTYELTGFTVQRDCRFSIRAYTSPVDYVEYGYDSTSDCLLSGGETSIPNMRADAASKYKWNTGVTMITLRANIESGKIEIVPHLDVPNQSGLSGAVPGVPFVAFAGNKIAQFPGNTLPHTQNGTTYGWQFGWQAYSAGHKRKIFAEDIENVGNTGQAVYNTVWPPRNRIDFSDGTDTWTSEAIVFSVNEEVKGKTLDSTQAIAELTANGDAQIAQETIDDIPANADWTRYDTRNTLIKGYNKLWSGWSGTGTWKGFHNWGRGTFNASGSNTVEPNVVYIALDEENNQQGGNFNFDEAGQYFRQFSFYSARYTENGQDKYKYYFVARLAAEDPVATIHRVTGDRKALEGRFRIQQQLATAKKVDAYKLYLIKYDNEGGVESETLVKESPAGFTAKSIDEFNALPASERSYIARELAEGNYRYKIAVHYENDPAATVYEGESPVMTVLPILSVDLTAIQEFKEEDGIKYHTFNLDINGLASDLTESQRNAITKYRLKVESQDGADFPKDVEFLYADGTVYDNTSADRVKSGYTLELTPDAGKNMPEIRMVNARVGRTYRFTLEIFTDESDTEPNASTTARAYVFGPRATIAPRMQYANSIGVQSDDEFITKTETEIHEAYNWIQADAQISLDVDASVSDRYDISYIVRYEYGDEHKDFEVTSNHVLIDNLPYPATGDAPVAYATYSFPVATVYTNHDESYTFTTPFTDTPLAQIAGVEFKAPLNGTTVPEEGLEVVLRENYAERFHGHHAYWYDALLGVSYHNLPVSQGSAGGALVGRFAERKASSGDTDLVPMEAGGMYAYAKVKTGANDFDHTKYLWHQSMPADHDATIHDHFNGGNEVTSFYAGHGQNQFFCTVDHRSDDASRGFGVISDWEAGNFMADATDNEKDWYTGKKVYRKVHHVHHEARYFDASTPYVAHSAWAFPQTSYLPVTAQFYYNYKMLTSYDDVTVTDASASDVRAKVPAKVPAATRDFADVLAGATVNVPLGNARAVAWDEPTTGIDNVLDNDDAAPIEYYDLQGRKVENPAAGIYIYRQGSRTGKVLIK